MSLIRHCDNCGEPIDLNGPLGDDSWVSVAVALDEEVREGGARKDYHRKCARDVTVAEVWLRSGMIPL
jgi:hypothetical protein